MTAANGNNAFFEKLKHDSERLWENSTLRRDIFGFQIQAGTKWLPGLNEEEIGAFEIALGFIFPQVYRDFLASMNGTDKETINLFGESGHPYSYSVGYYSYSRDLERVKDRIAWIYEEFEITEQEVRAHAIPHILPVIGHRFLIADNCDSNPVLSMYSRDIIAYARDLRTFLVNDIMHDHSIDEGIPSTLAVKYWLDRNRY